MYLYKFYNKITQKKLKHKKTYFYILVSILLISNTFLHIQGHRNKKIINDIYNNIYNLEDRSTNLENRAHDIENRADYIKNDIYR